MPQTSLKKLLQNLPPDQLQNVEALLTSEKAKSITTTILILAGTAGVVGMALAAPNSLKILAPFLKRRYRRPLRAQEQRQKVLKTFYYLKSTGHIRIKDTNKGIFACLTEKGKARLQHITNDIRTIQAPKKWAGSWWLVAADIPTKDHKIAADLFRRKLRSLRFYPLQRTLWVHPFDPRPELEFISTKYHIARFVTVMEISRLDTQDEQVLHKYFKEQRLL